MKQKLISILFFVLFFIVFWYFYGNEYQEFYEEKLKISQQNELIQEKVRDFSLQDTVGISSNPQLFVTPSKEFLDMLVEKIDTAKERVYMEVYIFTEKRVLESLKKAYQRWVDVQVILEKNPYRAPWLNDKRFKELEKSGISVQWSDTKNYALNHAKLLIIDQEAIISTGNMSYSTFTKNRDFFISTFDVDIVATLSQLFYNDFHWIKTSPYHPNIILSPEYSRSKISQMFQEAEKSIFMYFQYLQDDNLESLLIEKSQSGTDVKIVVDDDFFKEYQDKIYDLRQAWIEIHEYHKSSMHAKAILIDEKYLYIWSINFSTYSLDKNREVGIIISELSLINQFLDVFTWDISN